MSQLSKRMERTVKLMSTLYRPQQRMVDEERGPQTCSFFPKCIEL